MRDSPASAAALRRLLEGRAPHAADVFRSTLASLPASARDAFVDDVLGLEAPDDDTDALPRGCVPYVPCSVDILVRAIDQARIGADDVFIDVGSGIGRAIALVHCLTGATAIGIEVQPHLVAAARRLSAALRAPRVSTVHGDAVDAIQAVVGGTVFFLYCPFSGERLDRLLDHLAPVAATRAIRLCCVDMAALERPWLELCTAPTDSLLVYRSVIQ